MNAHKVAGEITFPEGLPGFESSRSFVLIVSPELGPFTMVQGIGPDAPAFLSIDPRRVTPGYDVSLDPRDLARLGAAPGQPLAWLALVSISPDGTPTVNLRAPLVINPATMRGLQLCRDDVPYPVDHPLKAA